MSMRIQIMVIMFVGIEDINSRDYLSSGNDAGKNFHLITLTVDQDEYQFQSSFVRG